jgi:ATP-dependent Lhr-like helicase
MASASFHPIVQQWFTDTFGDPTPAQTRGWAAIQSKKHTLIAAQPAQAKPSPHS